MPLDAICIRALTAELKERLVGTKVDKIQQPESGMLIFSLRSKSENLKLLVACGTGNARVHITNQTFENPKEPPMLCMLLRKHLTGARIIDVYQPVNDRLLTISFAARDELGFTSEKKLVIEMIGRSANAILVDNEGRITDCLRRMDFAGDELRRMLPGMIYRLPPKQDKLPLLECGAEKLALAIASADRTVPVDKWIMRSFSGVSPLICRELAYRCGNDYELLYDLLVSFCESVEDGGLKPYMLMEDDAPMDFSFMSISQYGGAVVSVLMPSFSQMLDEFFSRRDMAQQQKRRSHELSKTVRTLRDRQSRKLTGQKEDFQRTENREDIRKKAELITANLYRIKKGDRVLLCEDYYESGSPEISIPLNELKTPQQNAAALYKEYNKLKTAREHLSKLIADGEEQLDYLNSVLELLDLAESERDISDLRRELISTGYLRLKKNAKPDRNKAQAPHRFISDEGLEILAGRSNVQNDELTTKLCRRTDYWLHAQKYHGSHVIIRCDGLTPGELTIKQAAVIAAYYSQAHLAGKIAVDYTMIRFVHKPSGALPGRVVYTDYSTIVVESDEKLVERLSK